MASVDCELETTHLVNRKGIVQTYFEEILEEAVVELSWDLSVGFDRT